MHLPNKHRATSQRERRRFLIQDVSSGVFNLFLAAYLLEIDRQKRPCDSKRRVRKIHSHYPYLTGFMPTGNGYSSRA